MEKPAVRPVRPYFSSGPCAKPSSWTTESLVSAAVGRSHRSAAGKAKLKAVIDQTARLLSLPAGYRVAIVAASDTGAVEMAMWSLLGPRPVDVFAWESFGRDWVTDTIEELKLSQARSFVAPFGELPDLSQAKPDHDIVFTWNGTSSGVRVPDADWIADDRAGLTICDATSAVFAMNLPWHKLDATTFSWQKVMGGEAAHGMLILSPRALQRLHDYTPPWPVPKVYRMTRKGKVNEGIFEGETINTPSLLCVEDALFSLQFIESVGGEAGMIDRCEANAALVYDWLSRTPWVQALAREARTRSTTGVCLAYAEPRFRALPPERQAEFAKQVAARLEKEGVGFDLNAYRDAPPGLRVWCGGTVERADLVALLPWLEWAYAATARDFFAGAA